MAYRAFGPTDSLDPIESPDAVAVEPPFAPLELTVIDLAEIDPVASLGPPTRFARWFERWFGFDRPRPLADARLEALRRFALLARVTAGDLPGEEVRRFIDAGFTMVQARTLQRRGAAAG